MGIEGLCMKCVEHTSRKNYIKSVQTQTRQISDIKVYLLASKPQDFESDSSQKRQKPPHSLAAN